MQMTVYVNLCSYPDYLQTTAASGTDLPAISGIFTIPLPQTFLFTIQHNKVFSFFNQSSNVICKKRVKGPYCSDEIPLNRPVAVFQNTKPSWRSILSFLIKSCFLKTWPFFSFVYVLFSVLQRISDSFCFFSYSFTFKSTAAIISLIRRRALHRSLCSSVPSVWNKNKQHDTSQHVQEKI